MSKNIYLFSLQTFSSTGGIQKMTRVLAHTLYQISGQKNWEFKLWSLYDRDRDLQTQYIPAENFSGFGNDRTLFGLKYLFKAFSADIVIISHINLALIGLITKIINPKCKVVLIAHGVEVWRKLSILKNLLLKHCDKIICVSNFTKKQIIAIHHLEPGKCVVLNNAIDPFIILPSDFSKPPHLLRRYGVNSPNQIVFTLTRLASTEQYKGYEQVIKVIARIKETMPDIKYILSGNYDQKEEKRIKRLIAENKVGQQIIVTGFINEDELADHFLLADLFVLPSRKEGFGIVFIEALVYGLPVICGNADGSTDAIRNGELGTSINADDLDALESAMVTHLKKRLAVDEKLALQNKCLEYFSAREYETNLLKLLYNELRD